MSDLGAQRMLQKLQGLCNTKRPLLPESAYSGPLSHPMTTCNFHTEGRDYKLKVSSS